MVRDRVAACLGVIVAACMLIAFADGGTAPILLSFTLWGVWFVALHRFNSWQLVPQLFGGAADRTRGFLHKVGGWLSRHIGEESFDYVRLEEGSRDYARLDTEGSDEKIGKSTERTDKPAGVVGQSLLIFFYVLIIVTWMLIFFFFGGIAPIGLISGIALLVLFVAAESLLLGHLAGIGLLKVTLLMFTGWLIYAGWTFLGHPPPSTSPYTLISIRFVLFATETVFLWSCTSWLVGLVPVSLLLGVPDDEVPFARLLDRNVRLLILLPFVPIILAHAIGLPPRFSPWYALPLTLIYIVWICLCQSTRKRWLCVWALLLFFTMFVSPLAATYLQARAVFLAFPSIVELNPSLDGCAGPALFAHISDIHAVAGATRTFDGDVPGNTRLPRLLDAIASTRPAYLLVTGDVTDRGRVSEWETVLELLKPAAERIKVILAPGNHDLSGFFSELPSLGEAPRVEEFIRQQHSLFNGINDSAGASLANSFDNAPSRESPQYNNAQKAVRACYTNCQPQLSLNEEQWQIIKRHSADIERILRIENPLASQCFYRCQHSKAQEEIDYVDDYWKQYGESAFPLAWIDGDNGIAIFSLRFHELSGVSTVGTNAIGFLDDNHEVAPVL